MSRHGKVGEAARRECARLLRLVLGTRPGTRRFAGEPRSIAILAQRGLGDATLLTPLLRLLRRRFPTIAIHLVVFRPDLIAFFSQDPHVTAVHCPRGASLRTARHLRSLRFDVVYNSRDHLSRTFLIYGALLSGGFLIGQGIPSHLGLFDYLSDVEYHTNMAEKNASIMGAFGVAVAPEDCRPYVPPMPVSPAVSAWVAGRSDRSLIGLNISAGGTKRRWPAAAWKTLIDRCPGCRFVILSEPRDEPRRLSLEIGSPRVVRAPSTANLYEVSLMTARLRLLVSPDTSIVHVASATRTPVVGLYTDARHTQTRFGPFLVPHEIVASPTPQLADLPVDDVVAAVRRMLAP